MCAFFQRFGKVELFNEQLRISSITGMATGRRIWRILLFIPSAPVEFVLFIFKFRSYASGV
jgi:hypothetical protein